MMSADDVRKPRVHTQLHDRVCDCPPKIYYLKGNRMDFLYESVVCSGIRCVVESEA